MLFKITLGYFYQMTIMVRAILFILLSFFSFWLKAETIVVTNNLDAGPGSFRSAVDSVTDNDTIIINIRGSIVLDSPILFSALNNLTVIGPYPKHNQFKAGGSWTGSLFELNNCGNISFKGLGFIGGNGNTRHVSIENCADIIEFEKCQFSDVTHGMSGVNGGSVKIFSSLVKFSACSFVNNQSENGAAINVAAASNLTLTNCNFSNNYASSNAGALNIESGVTVTISFCTFYQNDSGSSSAEVIKAEGGTNVTIQHTAVGENGTDRQIRLNGIVSSGGGNRVKLNYLLEPTSIPTHIDDISTLGVTLGLRPEILTDGYGLQYWPIVDPASSLINTSATSDHPVSDIRGAPRNLKGSYSSARADAGAVEYTHLRVTNTSGDADDDNSLLWALDADQQKDALHYVEFDLSIPYAKIDIENTARVEDAAYIIDGFSQDRTSVPGPPEYGGSPGLYPARNLIEIDNVAGIDYGFDFENNSDESFLSGFRILNFDTYGIRIDENAITIQGCEIGIDSTGAAHGNLAAGIKVRSGENSVIGGSEHFQRNVISGNGLGGATEKANIHVTSRLTDVCGNIIGGARDGISPIASVGVTQNGVYLNDNNCNIGEATLNGGNIILNHGYGVYVNLLGDNCIIQNNLIGIGYNSLSIGPNSISGIFLSGSDGNIIGSTNSKGKNIIAHNQRGISLAFNTTGALNNSILGNSIFLNTNQGIDINFDDTVLENDSVENSGNNGELDFPVLLSSSNCLDSTSTITTYSTSVPFPRNYRVEFFQNTSPDALNGEGELFIGFQNIAVTALGETFTYDHGALLAEGISISSTITSISTGNTSEFSNNIVVEPGEKDPSFSYSSFCADSIGLPIVTGDEGGIFRFETSPGGGVLIDPETGEISGANEGDTYSVIYEVGGCGNQDTVSVNVYSTDASFVFNDFCFGTSGTPTSIATPGGAFSILSPLGDGAIINPSTGELTDGLPGVNYTVQYQVGPCDKKHTEDVLVIAPVDASFTYSSALCHTAPGPLAAPVTPGGIFSFDAEPGDGATINSTNGSITGSIEGASYAVKYEVGCSEPYVLTISVNSFDETFDYPDFCYDETGAPLYLGDTGGFFTFAGAFAPATITPSTGAINNAVEGTTYTVIYTDGVCGDDDTAYPVAILIDPSFSIDNFCLGESSTPYDIVTLGGSFSLDDSYPGVSIDPISGTLSSPAFGGNYGVIYTIDEPCYRADTVYVEILNESPFFKIDSFCTNGVSAPAYDIETPGGIFSFDPAPIDDATINASTGVISEATADNTYYVKYKLLNSCGDSLILPVNTYIGDASFNYSVGCPGEAITPTILGDIGGTFSSFPATFPDATLNGLTGEFIGGTEGNNYMIIYTEPICGVQDTFEISFPLIDESFFFDSFCSGDDSPIPTVTTPGGTFSFETIPVDGADINGVTGVISNSTEGSSYSVIYSVGSCLDDSDTIIVSTIVTDESFSLPMPLCKDILNEPAIISSPGGEFSFDPIPLDAIEINSLGQISNATEGGVYTVIYTIGECNDSDTAMFTIESTDESFTYPDFCADAFGLPNLINTPGGTFAFAPDLMDGSSIIPETGKITNGVPGQTYAIEYTVGPCNEKDTVLVYVFNNDAADFTISNFCIGEEEPATIFGSPGGLFSFVPSPDDGTLIDPATGLITNSPGGTYTVKYRTPDIETTCADSAYLDVTVYTLPIINSISSLQKVYCPEELIQPIEADVTGNPYTIYWYLDDSEGELLDSGVTFTPTYLNAGSNTYAINVIDSNNCASGFETYSLRLSDISTMESIPDFSICKGSNASLNAFGGNQYNWLNEGAVSNPNIADPIGFSLDEIWYKVQITNLDDCSILDSTYVTFYDPSLCNIEVYNAFSPNSDGINDIWYIEHLINFIPNVVTIYTRWGDEVIQIENYDNINTYWDGTDKNGKELPPNTYYFVIEAENTENRVGWVQLVK